MEDNSKFEVGKVYFKWTTFEGARVVSSWVYQGVVRREFSDTTCEKPYHFYCFHEYNSWERKVRAARKSGDSKRCFTSSGVMVNMATLEDAMKIMLTWEELLDDLEANDVS